MNKKTHYNKTEIDTLHHFSDDNTLRYLTILEGLVRSVDSENSLKVAASGLGQPIFTIYPTSKEVKDKTVKAILDYHHRINLKVMFSKSLKISNNISFTLK